MKVTTLLVFICAGFLQFCDYTFSQYFLYMSSVEGSDREQDSLTEEQEVVLKNNKMSRGRNHSRGSKNINSQDTLYKDALKQYLFGRFDIASQSCKKMIANNPENPDPYFLMATMYQQAAKKNNNEAQLYKSVEYFFFHAYYSVPSVQKWTQVANMSYQLELYQQAAYCYGRALKMNKTDLQISLKRAECLQHCLEIKKAANIYKRIIQKISNSAQIYKRYAKLRFRRQQYTKSREILLSYPYFQSDINIKFMIAETYLKERKFLQLFSFINKNILQQSDPPITNIEQLQFQFVQMLFICCVNCGNKIETELDISDMLQFLKRQYEKEQSNIYEEIVFYIKKQNPEVTYELLKFLLNHQPHQTIQNYLYCSQFLVKQNRYNEAIKILQNGIYTQKNKNSVQLKTQLNYLKITFKSKRNQKNLRVKSFPYKKQLKQEIFYSDEQIQKKEQELSQNSRNNYEKEYQEMKNEESPSIFEQDSIDVIKNKKKKRIIKKKNTQAHHLQIKDPQTLGKLIQNNQLTLSALKKQLQTTKDNEQKNMIQPVIYRTLSDVKQCLNYLIQIQSIRQKSVQQATQFTRTQSIFNNRQPKKRRMIVGHMSRRHNLISKNSANLLGSIKDIIYFMKEYLKMNKFLEVIEFAQLLSKAHFFKWQNRIMQFKFLKKQVYQLGLLACLQLKKYGKSIFFLRYLISKNPLNQLYLGIAERIMRESKSGKLFINKLIKRGAENATNELQIQQENETNSKEQVKLYYLTGIQYMENCFFELALNMFSKVAKILQENQQICQNQQYKFMCKSTFMCMSTCFLQMASSRTVFNKLDFVNRSAFCLAKYKSYCEHDGEFNEQVMYNLGRWYSYVKLYPRAMEAFEEILEKGKNKQVQTRTALNLIIIYKDLDLYDKANQVSMKYFSQK